MVRLLRWEGKCTVLVWEPPRRVAFTWHPGREPNDIQQIEVQFAPGDEGTRVTLIHRGWEFFGAKAAMYRAGYNVGWDDVLSHYLDRRSRARSVWAAVRLLGWMLTYPSAVIEMVRSSPSKA